MSDGELKLYYFNIPGKAESIRLSLAYQGIQFKDIRFSGDDFRDMKAKGMLMFDQVPALEVRTKTGESTILNQSAAILRYVAKVGNGSLYPVDPIVAARVDAICDQEADAFQGLRVAKYKRRFGFGFLNDEQHQGALQSVFDSCNLEIIPGHLTLLQKQLTTNGTDWLAGTPTPSIADFMWCPTLKQCMDFEQPFTGDANVVDAFPQLKALVERFYKLPGIQQWYANTAGFNASAA